MQGGNILSDSIINPVKDARRLWNSKTAGLRPYVPGEQPRERKYIKLNTNENPWPPAAEVIEAIGSYDLDRLRLYPDPTSLHLREMIAEYYGLKGTGNVFVGNGSDEILAFAFQAFFEKDGQEVIFPDITCQPDRAVVLANPNAPTGIAVSLEQIETIVKADPDRLVLIDEAYVDFGAESAVSLLERYDNLLVVQTFSKSRSLAGMRVGYAMGSPELIEALQRIRDSINSYTLDSLAQEAAAAAIGAGAWFEKTRQALIEIRAGTAASLKAMGFIVLPSKANFLFVRHGSIPAPEVYSFLREKGILVRHFNADRINQFLRISIGTEQDMEILCAALADLTAAGKA
jgi:histidinol-phosphate aminotransferase